MRSAYCRWLLVALLAASSGVATTGCGNDQKTINRVQPNALEKKIFQGEWYSKGTIIDTQVDAPIAVGNETGFDRIKWEIQENYLFAKRSFQLVRGIEDHSVTKDNEKESVIAVYKIQKHFDIRRDYNPATGEQTNVITENDQDRPWYEREFMRVDWSQNLLDGFGISNGIGVLKAKPVALFDQNTSAEEKSSLAPYFERDEDDNVVYFDIVNKYWAEPASTKMDVDGDGRPEDVGACLLTVNSNVDCQPAAIQVRQSFSRVPTNRDYEPKPYTTDRMARFGFFLTKRDNYNDDYGTTVAGREVYAVRHNLWQKSHLTNDKGELIKCGVGDRQAELALIDARNHPDDSAAQQKAGGQTSVCTKANIASTCDLAYGKANGLDYGVCTIPYTKRELRPIVYYVTANLAPDLMIDALEVGKQWTAPFQETVASLRKLECQRYGLENCGQYSADKVRPMFVVCHNPVTKDDDKVCGEAGFSPRYGDLRYSFISWVDEAHSKFSGAPLGLGPASADPLTGEVISGVANLYGDGFDQQTAFYRDVLAMMRGDLDTTDPQSNAAYAAWIANQNQQVEAMRSGREADRHVIPLDGHDMAEANADMNFKWAMDRLPKYQQPVSLEFMRSIKDQHWKAIGNMHDTLAIARQGRANLNALRGTMVEDLLINDEYTLQAGLAPGSALPEADRARLSPLSAGGAFNARGISRAHRELARQNANSTACLIEASDLIDEGLIGILREIEKAVDNDSPINWYGKDYKVSKGAGVVDYEAVKQMLRHPIFFGLTAHEVGHTLGLRHNFSGSYDALNYQSPYWKIRDDGVIRSRAFDPMTQAEIDGRIREYQYSTVMDYGNNFLVTEAHGVGKYDHAAIKMGYGDIVEVFTNSDDSADTISKIDAQADPFTVFQVDPRGGGNTIKALHYSAWPQIVGGVDNIDARTDAFYTDLSFVPSPFFGDGGNSLLEKDGRTMSAVPYMYCGDEFADSRPTCNRYDAGADAYETMQSIIDNYWMYYPFSNFMRQRIGWDPAGVPARTQSRFFDKLSQHSHIYSLYRQFFEPFLGPEFFEAEDGFGLYSLGVRATYDLFRKVISTPEPAPAGSSLGYEELVDGTKVVGDRAAQNVFDRAAVNIDAFQGRYLRSRFDIGPASEWIYFTSSGWFKEKQLALESLLMSDTGFLGTDTSPDVREYSSSFYTAFPDSMSEFLRAMFAGDFKTYAPRYVGGNLLFPTPSEILKRGTTMQGDVISPNVAFTLQLSAMAYATSLIPNNFDQDFVNRSRIFAAGSSEAVALDLPAGTVSYKDARSGIVYYAGSYVRDDIKGMEGKSLETGPGAAMINYANALKARVETEVTNGNAGAAAQWQAKLNDFVDNLDVLRFLGNRLGHGSDGQFFGITNP